jgi:hypothetical protein
MADGRILDGTIDDLDAAMATTRGTVVPVDRFAHSLTPDELAGATEVRVGESGRARGDAAHPGGERGATGA